MCQAFLIEDLLSDGFKFVLIALFLSDSIERKFGQYRQMSEGTFLVGLKDVVWSERILKIKSLIKESMRSKMILKLLRMRLQSRKNLFIT